MTNVMFLLLIYHSGLAMIAQKSEKDFVKILVTGATGFIGQHLTRRLVSSGNEVIALVRNPQKAAALNYPGVSFLKGDLSIFTQPALELPQCDIVIHLAGQIIAKKSAEFEHTNFHAVKNLVACLMRQTWQPRRFIFASSLAAAGPTEFNTPLSEQNQPNPNDPYGKSKWEAERFLATAPFPVTAFRPGAVLGPRDQAFLTVYKMARNGLGLQMRGMNSQFSFVYIDDLTSAIEKMLGVSHEKNETYFVSHDDIVDVSTLWKNVGEVMNKKVAMIKVPRLVARSLMRLGILIDERQYIQMITPAYLGSSRLLQDNLGWKAQTDLKSAIEKTYIGYLKDGWLKP